MDDEACALGDVKKLLFSDNNYLVPRMDVSEIQREGFYIELIDDSIWVVKGCCSINDRVIAIPRVVNDVKIKRLGEAMKVVAERYSRYLMRTEFSQEYIPAVPINDIKHIYKPSKRVCDKIHGEIVDSAHELLKILDEKGFNAFLTGSLIYCGVDESSDIDIVVYVDDNNVDPRDIIKDLLDKNILIRLSDDETRNIIEKVSEGLDPLSHIVLLKRSIHEFRFRNHVVSMRYVNCSEFVKKLICSEVKEYRYYEDSFEIINDDLGVYTPSIYFSRNSLGEEIVLYSHRIRYANLRSGDVIRCKGYIEYIIDGSKRFNLDRATCSLEKSSSML